MPHARTFSPVLIAVSVTLAGCASRTSGAADHFHGARNAKAAALGYYRSISHPHVGSHLRFACTHSGGGSEMDYTVTGVATGAGAVAASVERSRSAWIVALKQTDDVFPFARYKVLREGNGFCVGQTLSS